MIILWNQTRCFSPSLFVNFNDEILLCEFKYSCVWRVSYFCITHTRKLITSYRVKEIRLFCFFFLLFAYGQYTRAYIIL